MNIFTTHTMTVRRGGLNGSIIATNLSVQLDTVNIDIILSSQGAIPMDSYDAYCDSLAYTPQRSDYLVDTTSEVSYQIAGNPAIYSDHWEARCTKYLGTTP